MLSLLSAAADDAAKLASAVKSLSQPLEKLGLAMMECWSAGGKVLTCGNGGSCADAIHLAEELSVRFAKDRRGLAAVALADGAAMTCAANDYGWERVFARQVEALGNAGDLLVGFSTSGNSKNVIAAFEAAKSKKMITCAFLGKDGGKLKGVCDIELLVPHKLTHRVQEAHLLLYHTLCEWVDHRVD
jgi:D-sedoheptulose 7-phosphate isomerase